VNSIRDAGADHVHVSAWDDLENVVRRRPVNVLVLDPYADHISRANDIARLLRQFPSTPVIAYTQFIPPALRALTTLARHGLYETVLFQVDDDCSRLSSLLVRAALPELVARMLHEMRNDHSLLPPLLVDSVTDLFKRPHAYTSGRDLVLSSGIALTNLYHTLRDAGLASPKRLFIAARVLHAVGYLRDPGYTVEQVAEKTGYLHPRVLTQHTLSVFGVRPSALRNMPEDELLTPLVRWVKLDVSKPAITASSQVSSGLIGTSQLELETHPSEEGGECRVPSEANYDVIWVLLLGYGKHLELTGRSMSAAYVYLLMVDVLATSEDADPVILAAAFVHCGLMLRLLGRLDVSINAYQRAQVLAEQGGATVLALRAQTGIANTLRTRGNLGNAESLLDRIVTDARKAGIIIAEAGALHSRGGIRQLRGRYDEAMADYFMAYELTRDITNREVILADLATCAAIAGYRTVARDAHRFLAHTASFPVVRTSSLVNLLELAVLDGQVTEFKRIQKRLREHSEHYPPPMEHEMHAALYTAAGVERFGTWEDAIVAYRSVLAKAQSIGMHQIAFQVEERLAALMNNTATQRDQPTLEPPSTLQRLIDTIAELSVVAPSLENI
jgi:tetratricopeptide (TPR) repeat protein